MPDEKEHPTYHRHALDPPRIVREAGARMHGSRGRRGRGVRYEFLSPNVLYEPSPITNAGKPDQYPPGSVTADPKTGIYIVHGPEGFYALSAICTHLGCLTVWAPEQESIACPCHGSKFTPEGREDRRSGAAPVCRG